MIKLKIKDVGHTIAIPGMPVFRSPVDLDISKLDIRVVSMYLKTSGIEKYEIVAENDEGNKEVYTQKDFDLQRKKRAAPKKQKEDINKRFSKLENMMELLLAKKQGNESVEREQIYNKLDKLEKIFRKSDGSPGVVRQVLPTDTEPEIEELDSFIPEVDISGMKLKSDNIKTVKQDDTNLEDAADILSGLTRRG